jgi:hypothetical protein
VRGPSCCARLFPPFLPAGERCAVTCGESIIRVLADLHLRPFPEQIFPDSAPRPAHKLVADCRRWATGRAITPATAAFQPVPNAANDATIDPRSTPQTSVGKQGSNPLPLLIARPKHIPAHNFNSFPPNNHYLIVSAERFMSSDPVHKLREKLGAPNYPPLPVLLWPVAFPSRFLTDRRRP